MQTPSNAKMTLMNTISVIAMFLQTPILVKIWEEEKGSQTTMK